MGGDHYLNLQPGTIVNGRYEVVKCLGTGSMGMVYACRHRELAGHIVAMKVLFSEVARDEIAATRFRNEIVASYGVSHPNVVRAYEYFRDGDLIAFTMEFVGGGDIADKISHNSEITIEEITGMLSQMCSGVQAIHDAGIVHRDLKPENILLTTTGDIKITDFGIARTNSGPKLTDHGGVVGTIDYVSPEYLEKGQVDARSDIYALGVIAYEMITHESPFRGKSVIETMTMRLRTDPEAPHHLRSDCPIALSNIVLKAMARDPELRYQRARDMYDDLANLAKGLPVAPPQQSSNTSDSEKVQNLANGTFDSDYSDYSEDWTSDLNEGAHAGYAAAGNAAGAAQEIGGRVSAPTQMLSMPSGMFSPVPDDLEDFVDESEAVYAQTPRMDSMLSRPSMQDWYRDPQQRDSQRGGESMTPPRVTISHGHLSTDRLKQLSGALEEPEGSLFRTLVSSIVIFVLGFGVGWLLLRQFKPELFESDLKEAVTELYSSEEPAVESEPPKLSQIP